jgi:hypothetical protein
MHGIAIPFADDKALSLIDSIVAKSRKRRSGIESVA